MKTLKSTNWISRFQNWHEPSWDSWGLVTVGSKIATSMTHSCTAECLVMILRKKLSLKVDLWCWGWIHRHHTSPDTVISTWWMNSKRIWFHLTISLVWKNMPALLKILVNMRKTTIKPNLCNMDEDHCQYVFPLGWYNLYESLGISTYCLPMLF